MGRVLRVTVPYEGGYYSPTKDPTAPIRIYSDRWIEDDIVRRLTGQKRRNRLSRKEFRLAQRYARENHRMGRV